MADADSDQLDRVDEWDAHGNPYWNGVARSGGHAPGTGKLHRARIENGRVVEVECHAAAESWVAFTATSTPQKNRQTCSRCGKLTKVPGVGKGEFWSRVQLTDEYAPEEWSPKPATDGGVPLDERDPAEDPRACSVCGVHIGLRSGDYCDGCARDIGAKPPLERCLHCGQRAPQEQMEPIDLSGEDEYYPEIRYLCRGCSGGDS